MKTIHRPISSLSKRLIDLNHKKVYSPPTFKLFPPKYSKDKDNKTVIAIHFEITGCDKDGMVLRSTLETEDQKPHQLANMYATIGQEYAKRVLQWEGLKGK